jgi:hypothetical protein
VKPLGRLALLAAVVFATSGARFTVRAQPSPRPRVHLAPALVLARYKAGLATVARPKSLVYQYTVEQLGLQNLEQAHRVYRSGGNERDETLMVDGYTLQYPSIRIFRNRSDRYDIVAVAPRPARYSFAYSRVLAYAGGDSYVFRTVPLGTGAFAVSEIEIDGRTFLPSVVRFKIAGNGARGSGELRFGPSQTYWLVRQASVNAHLTRGASAHERITWSNYQFPSSLPASTFTTPQIVATPLIAPTPTPTPVGAPLSPP